LKRYLLVSLVVFLLAASSISVQNVQAVGVSDYRMCRDVDMATYRPLGITQVFMTTDVAAILWVNLTLISQAAAAKWEWYRPDGSLYQTVAASVPAPEPGTYWVWYIVYGFISIEGYEPAEKTGMWSVKFYVDTTLVATTIFEIVDYTRRISDLTGSLVELQSKYYGLSSNFTALESDYQALGETYDTLMAEFDSVQSDYQTLSVTYNSLVSEFEILEADYATLNATYNSLTSEHDALRSEYDAALGDLNNARNIMYVTIATTILFVITTAYLAMKKPKV